MPPTSTPAWPGSGARVASWAVLGWSCSQRDGLRSRWSLCSLRSACGAGDGSAAGDDGSAKGRSSWKASAS
jgi:hypothetical protein